MKLILAFNGAQLVSDNLQQLLGAAGVNTSINVNTAQAIPIPTLLAAIQAAGSKSFSAEFNGAQLNGDNLQQAIVAAGANTTISVNTAQQTPVPTLIAAIQTAGTKNFAATFDGDLLVGDSLQQAVMAAGANTTIGVNTAQAAPITTLLAAIQAAGSKNFNAAFNGNLLIGENLQQATAAAGANTTISVDTAQAVPIATLLSAIQTPGDKKFSATFNGAQLIGDNLQQAIMAGGANTSIGVNTAEDIPITTLLSAIQAAGSKNFSADFDGALLNDANLQQAIVAAGANTTISVSTAQSTPIPTLIAAIQTAGAKNFEATFDGDQLVGDNLQQAANVAGTNTTISVNSAHAVPLATLLTLISTAG